MSRLSARRTGTARVAVLGSPTLCGGRLREALAKFGVPGSRVDLYASGEDAEAILSEYDGEARLIQQAAPADVEAADVVFLCEDSKIVERIASGGGAAALVDLVRPSSLGARSTVIHMDINPEAAQVKPPVFAVPHDLSTLLLDLLHPLERELRCRDVVALVLRPAADFGEAGVEELREQTVRLLNFARPPSSVFGRQLAFNLLPQGVHPDSGNGLENRVTSELAELLDWSENCLALRLVLAPVFYGHALQLRLRFAAPTTEERAGQILEDAGWTVVTRSDKLTPMDVATEREARVVEVTPDGQGGLWLWAVAGEAHARSAELAVRLAAAVSDM